MQDIVQNWQQNNFQRRHNDSLSSKHTSTHLETMTCKSMFTQKAFRTPRTSRGWAGAPSIKQQQKTFIIYTLHHNFYNCTKALWRVTLRAKPHAAAALSIFFRVFLFRRARQNQGKRASTNRSDTKRQRKCGRRRYLKCFVGLQLCHREPDLSCCLAMMIICKQ